MGQLGNGGTSNSAVPTLVPGLSVVMAVAAGSDYSLVAACDSQVGE